MTFADILAGEAIFLDANTLVYHFTSHVQQLVGFHNAIERILQSRIQVLTIPAPLVAGGTMVSRLTGLLSNDALIAAVMQANGLTRLASADKDFDRVAGLTRYAPV
jgi:predicted nucleic acid-binding protein